MTSHEGHRQRLKNRFRREGLDNFDQINVLELLLFFTQPRKDTNPIAHALLDHFGSLAGVLEASHEQLAAIPGVGEHTATLLKLVPAINRYYMRSRKDAAILKTVAQCGSYLIPRFCGLRDESVCLLCLDATCRVLCCNLIGQGSVNSANVPVRKLVEQALSVNATSVILAHNHPSGIAIPSKEDIDATEAVRNAMDAMGIILADHIIVADEDYVSMVESGIYRPNHPK